MLNPAHSQRGAATVEFYVVAMLALLPLCLGMLQTSLLLIDKHHLDHAAFMAARAGAAHQGDVNVMRGEYSRVLSPLFVEPTGGLDAANIAARVGAAQARAIADVAAFSQIRVVSPGAAAQRDFGEIRDGSNVIASDSLQYRGNAVGMASGLTLQQANMLRVEFAYCRPVIVPFVRLFLMGLLRQLNPEPASQRCYAAGRVPIRSMGTAPMQSDFRVPSAAN